MPLKGSKRKSNQQETLPDNSPTKRTITEENMISHIELNYINTLTSYYSSFTAKLINIGMTDLKARGVLYLWRDGNGNEIRACLWTNLMDRIHDLLTVGNTYTVKEFKVHKLNPMYKRKGSTDKYQVELVKQTTFDLIDMADDVPDDNTYTIFVWSDK